MCYHCLRRRSLAVQEHGVLACQSVSSRSNGLVSLALSHLPGVAQFCPVARSSLHCGFASTGRFVRLIDDSHQGPSVGMAFWTLVSSCVLHSLEGDERDGIQSQDVAMTKRVSYEARRTAGTRLVWTPWYRTPKQVIDWRKGATMVSLARSSGNRSQCKVFV